MIYFLIKRVLLAVPTCLAVSLVCFLLLHLAPGDPVTAFLPPQASAEVIARVNHELGFDRPIAVQFAQWLIRAIHGDLGTSIATGRPVASEVTAAFENSLILAALAIPLAVIFGTLLGLASGYWRGTMIDKVASAVTIGGVSVPHYWLAIVLVILFSVWCNWLPAMGAGPGGSSGWRWDWQHVQFAILPAVSIAVIPMSIIGRTVRAVVAEVLGHEFVGALRAKGLGNGKVFVHVVRNSGPTSLAVVGIQVGYLLGGSILVETVFAWPGAGYLLNTAIFQRDLPVLQGTVLVLTLFFVALNVAVDILQVFIDPRIRRY